MVPSNARQLRLLGCNTLHSSALLQHCKQRGTAELWLAALMRLAVVIHACAAAAAAELRALLVVPITTLIAKPNLVGDTHDEDASAIDCLTAVVQRECHLTCA